jgi:hypothetical protein
VLGCKTLPPSHRRTPHPLHGGQRICHHLSPLVSLCWHHFTDKQFTARPAGLVVKQTVNKAFATLPLMKLATLSSAARRQSRTLSLAKSRRTMRSKPISEPARRLTVIRFCHESGRARCCDVWMESAATPLRYRAMRASSAHRSPTVHQGNSALVSKLAVSRGLLWTRAGGRPSGILVLTSTSSI